MISGVHRPVTDRGFLVDHESSEASDLQILTRERREIVGANRGDVGGNSSYHVTFSHGVLSRSISGLANDNATGW